MTLCGWINVSVRCGFDQADAACEAFECSGAVATTVDAIDAQADAASAQVTGLFDEKRYSRAQLQRNLLALSVVSETSSIQECRIEDRDWVRASQSDFKAVDVAGRLRIAAPWHDRGAHDPATVVINPSVAFGTGHHPTTRLCLEFIARCDLTRTALIDYGCGTGVIALAAIRLGADFAWGIDNDPDAIAESQANAARNDLDRRYCALTPEDAAIEGIKAGIVVANLYSEALCELAGSIGDMVCEGGWLALSGILQTQADMVRMAYCDRFEFAMETDQEWVLLSGCKRKDG